MWDYSSIENWDCGITPHLKFGFWDYTPFEIAILGLPQPPYQGHNHLCKWKHILTQVEGVSTWADTLIMQCMAMLKQV